MGKAEVFYRIGCEQMEFSHVLELPTLDAGDLS